MIELKDHAKSGYDSRAVLLIRGDKGLAGGQIVRVSLGETITCGRSRHCGWSLKRSPVYLKTKGEGRLAIQKTLEFTSVSRRHVKIAFLAPGRVELENLSPNGTLVDGHRVDRLLLEDLAQRTHQIQLGPHGPTLVLETGSLPL